MNKKESKDPFKWYWANYKASMEWIKKHEVAYWKSNAMVLKAENEELLRKIHDMQLKQSSPVSRKSSRSPSMNSKRSKLRRVRSKKKKNKEMDVASQSDDVEVSPELIEFFKISLRHKKERQKEKDLREASLAAFLPPQEAMDLRQKEMKELFGEGSQKIMGMETAMTLAYERFVDQKAPEYWPDLPLNLN